MKNEIIIPTIQSTIETAVETVRSKEKRKEFLELGERYAKLFLSYLEKNPNVKIYDHDVDQSPNFGTILGTRGLPTFYCYVYAMLKGQLVGSVPESKLAEFVAQHSS